MLKSITPKIVRKSEMSVEETSKTPPKSLKTTFQLQNKLQNQVNVQEKKKPQSVKAVIHSTNTFRYHRLCGEALDESDTTLMARFPYSPTYTQKNHLIVKNLVYIISNWTHDKYPNVLYICLRGYGNGYRNVTVQFDAQGQQQYVTYSTDRIAALQLDSVTATMDQSDVRTYQLRYSIRDSVTWELSSNQADNLDFEMRVDDSDTAQIMPLPSPLAFNFQVRSSL